MGKLEIVDYGDEHRDELVAVALAVRSRYPVYPPPASAGDTAESFERWLSSDEPLVRKVALLDGEVIGHGMLSEPHSYITDALGPLTPKDGHSPLAEIGKLFVSPLTAQRGTGAALLNGLVTSAKSMDRISVSCILDDSPESLALHRKLGFRVATSFDGISGLNHILTHWNRI